MTCLGTAIDGEGAMVSSVTSFRPWLGAAASMSERIGGCDRAPIPGWGPHGGDGSAPDMRCEHRGEHRGAV